MRVGDAVTLGLRPEHLVIGGESALALQVQSQYVENLGGSSQLYTRTAGGVALNAQAPGRHATTRGENMLLAAAPEHAHLFDSKGQAL